MHIHHNIRNLNIFKLYLFTLWFYNGGKKLQNNIQGLHERFVQIIWRLIINIHFFNSNYQKNHTEWIYCFTVIVLWFKNCAWSLAGQFKIWCAIWYESNWSFKNKNSQKFIDKPIKRELLQISWKGLQNHILKRNLVFRAKHFKKNASGKLFIFFLSKREITHFDF